MHFKNAIVKPPGKSFDKGITSAELGAPDLTIAREQHQAYSSALEKCGITLSVLQSDDRYPDSTFVEDTAVLTSKCAVLTNPGAVSRRGELASIEPAIAPYYDSVHTIQAPGTLDGGDVCQAGNHFFIGISERTNAAGAHQLVSTLVRYGHSSSFVDIRGFDGLLHLKSGIAYLDDQKMVMVKGLEKLADFDTFEIIFVDEGENYAANCVRINDLVLVADGFPKIADKLSTAGFNILPLQVSEFQKMDGGLSCLSLRF
jgi:dimethylargininase